MSDTHHYASRITWSGARHGTTRSYTSYSREFTLEVKGKAALTCSADPVFRGDPALYNPEDLFISTLSSCHMLWYLHLCADAGIHVMEYIDEVTGEMKINADDSGKFISVTLHPHVLIVDPDQKNLAKSLHEIAHQKCFIANSVNFPVHVQPEILLLESLS